MFDTAARGMSVFDPLALALEGWYGAPLCELPEALRQRVARELLIPWDHLSAEQRHNVAEQLDYQRNPENEKERQYWEDFVERERALKAQVAQWEAVATPTAGDLALRETQLKALRQELDRMYTQERLARGDFGPERNQFQGESDASSASQGSPVRYVAYPKAMHQLTERIGATPEELAAWICLGPKDGGIAAYLNANELDPPPRFHFSVGSDDHDYVSPLMACWFRADEIARFDPADRYITGSTLIERWSGRPGLKALGFVRAKIRESRLLDLHPIYGGTQGTFSEEASFPPLTTGLFPLSQVEMIEAEDFAIDWEPGVSPVSALQPSSVQVPGVDAQAAADADAIVDVPPSSTDLRNPANANEDVAIGADHVALGNPCSVFLAMQKLVAEELSIAFVGDRAESGLGANNMLELSARKQTRRVALATLQFVDRRKGGLNSQGAILLGITRGKRLTYTPSNATKMKRLRDALRKHIGLTGDPFEPYREENGWVPRFEILDKRGAADERAKREAERRTDSLDQLVERGSQLASSGLSPQGFDDENDAADDWLRKNDPDVPT